MPTFTPPAPNLALVLWNPTAFGIPQNTPASVGYVNDRASLVLLGAVEMTAQNIPFVPLSQLISESQIETLPLANRTMLGQWLPETSSVGNQVFFLYCAPANLRSANQLSSRFLVPDTLPPAGYHLVSQLLAQTVVPSEPASVTVQTLIESELASGAYNGPPGIQGPAGTTNYNTLANKPALGTAASRNVGTGANDVAPGNYVPSSIASPNGTTTLTATDGGEIVTPNLLQVGALFVPDGGLSVDDTGTRVNGVIVVLDDDPRLSGGGGSATVVSTPVILRRREHFDLGVGGFLTAQSGAGVNIGTQTVNNFNPSGDAARGTIGLSFLGAVAAGAYAGIYTPAAFYGGMDSLVVILRASLTRPYNATTNKYMARFGFGDNMLQAQPTRSLGWFEYDGSVSPNWLCGTAQNGTRTVSDSGIPVVFGHDDVVNNFQLLRIEQTEPYASTRFYIGGALAHTNTTNLPDNNFYNSQMLCTTMASNGVDSYPSWVLDYKEIAWGGF